MSECRVFVPKNLSLSSAINTLGFFSKKKKKTPLKDTKTFLKYSDIKLTFYVHECNPEMVIICICSYYAFFCLLS